ncbi:hypothetical protein LAT59_04515, partial [Candidatus Gracilibacteria bacterium]|nr:hypothetical protein [Candidatus Gracilibacteria bacterium]
YRDISPQNIPTNASLVYLEDTASQVNQDALFFAFYTYAVSQYTTELHQIERLIKNYIESFLSYYKDNSSAMQYFSYLLEEKLMEFLNNPQNTPHSLMLLHLSEYIRISQMSFNSSDREKKSLLYIYQDVIELLEGYIGGTFFQPERTQTNLLTQDRTQSLSSPEFIELEKNVLSLFRYYTTNDTLLDEEILRDSLLRISIRRNYLLFLEYIAALRNYESYTLLYDTVSRELLDRGRGNDENQIITQASILEYLSQFQGFGLANASIDIGDNGHVKVEGVSLSGRSLSFTLLPRLGNRLRDIVVDGDELNFEYPLDDIEFDWNERRRTASENERDRYDFRRFFLITFVETRRDIDRDIIVDHGESIQEDRVIAVFKRETLLGENGEFLRFADIMYFTYNDIIVERRDDTFNIFLKDIGLRLTPQENRNNRIFEGFFSSEYILTDTHQDFRDMKINFYVDRERSDRTVFGENTLHIVGDIARDDTRAILQDITQELQNILSLYSTLNNEMNLGEVLIQYYPQNKNLRIRFDFGEERHTIVYASSMIQNYIRGRERVISEATPVNRLFEYLQ